MRHADWSDDHSSIRLTRDQRDRASQRRGTRRPSRTTRLMIARSLALLSLALPARALVAQRPTTSAPITLPATHAQTLRSAVNGREYHIAVALPLGYRETGDTTRYPVLYVLDGGAHLPLLASMFRLTNRSGRSGDVILVGIGYYPSGAFTPTPPGQVPGRNVDYTTPPFPARPAASGDTTTPAWIPGAPAFLRVLRDEVIPLVERRYRTTSDRALHGHSFGGLFATYVLFEDPDLFSRYAIMSPAYWWDGESAFARETAFRRRSSSLPKQVYLGVGGLEGPGMVGLMWRMAAALCSGVRARSYEGLRLTAEVIPDEHHGSAAVFARPLRAFYPPYQPVTPREDACRSL